MTEEQRRIAIAKACGWTDCEYIESLGLCKGKHKEFRGQYDSGHTALPDYLNDLNAMHEAEKVLTEDQFYLYGYHLDTITLPKNSMSMFYVDGPEAGMYRELICATASQRSEAFLRTIGKWEKTK